MVGQTGALDTASPEDATLSRGCYPIQRMLTYEDALLPRIQRYRAKERHSPVRRCGSLHVER